MDTSIDTGDWLRPRKLHSDFCCSSTCPLKCCSEGGGLSRTAWKVLQKLQSEAEMIRIGDPLLYGSGNVLITPLLDLSQEMGNHQLERKHKLLNYLSAVLSSPMVVLYYTERRSQTDDNRWIENLHHVPRRWTKWAIIKKIHVIFLLKLFHRHIMTH